MNFVFIYKTDETKPVKLDVNGTMILPPLVFPGQSVSVITQKNIFFPFLMAKLTEPRKSRVVPFIKIVWTEQKVRPNPLDRKLSGPNRSLAGPGTDPINIFTSALKVLGPYSQNFIFS